MTVIVSLKIELDASASLSQMESQIEEAGRAADKLSHLWKRAVSHAGHEAKNLADLFWAGGSAAQAAALPHLSPTVSPGSVLFGRGPRMQCHARFA